MLTPEEINLIRVRAQMLPAPPVHRRAKRRHHRERVINKRRKYFSANNRPKGAMHKGACFCSCELCCNLRHNGAGDPLTIQEKREAIRARESLSDITFTTSQGDHHA